jgi:predicted phosphodiesterase
MRVYCIKQGGIIAGKRSDGAIVVEYLKKYPTSPSRTIARLLCSEYPKIFTDLERARNTVRYYRGSNGAENRSKAIETFPQISIPEPVPELFRIIELGDCLSMMVSADWHIPYHDEDALESFMERTTIVKPKTILLLGDIFDFYQCSKFERDPRARDLKEEIESGVAALKELRRLNPKARIIFKYGNHDERYDLDLARKAPEFFKLPDVRLDAILNQRMSDEKIEIVKDKCILHIHGLTFLHGHEYIAGPFGGGVNPARGLFNRAKASAMAAHNHQTSEHTEPTITGEIIVDWSIGCLCGLHPQYAPLNKWNHGWAEIEKDGDMFRVYNRKLINYRMV